MSDSKASLPAGFVRLVSALMGLHACMAVARVTSTLWLLQNGYSAMVVGIMLALVSVTPALLGAPSGAWADRYGIWRPLLGGTVCALAGTAAAWVWPSVPTLAAAALGTGAALALAAVAIQREVALMAQAQEGGGVPAQALYSWTAMGPALSNAASPVLAGLVIDHLGFRSSLFLAVLLAPLGLVLLRAYRATPWPAQQRSTSLMPAWDLLRLRPFRVLLLLNVLFAVSWDAHSLVVPVLGHARELSASSIGLLLGAFALGSMGVRLLIVRYAGRFSDRSALRAALVTTAAVFAIYAWLPGAAGMAIGSFVVGLALGSVQPTMLAAMTHATPFERHGQALGMRMLATNGTGVLMPLAFGTVASFGGAAAPMWLMAALAALCWPATRYTRSS